MTTTDAHRARDAGLPGVHQGDARGDLGRDHEARVHGAGTSTAAASRRRARPARRCACSAPDGASSGATRSSRSRIRRAGSSSVGARSTTRRWRPSRRSRDHLGDRAARGRRVPASRSCTTSSSARRRPRGTCRARAGWACSAASRRCSRPGGRCRGDESAREPPATRRRGAQARGERGGQLAFLEAPAQLPSVVPGRFMRASSPRPRTSCAGKIESAAREPARARSATSAARRDRGRSSCAPAASSASHQPSAVCGVVRARCRRPAAPRGSRAGAGCRARRRSRNQHRHAGHAEREPQALDRRGDHTEVLGDQRSSPSSLARPSKSAAPGPRRQRPARAVRARAGTDQ